VGPGQSRFLQSIKARGKIMTMFVSESSAKKLMVEISRRMQVRGFLGTNDVNISWKIGHNVFLTLATGIFADTLEENQIIKMDLDGNVISAHGPYTPSADAGLHIQIFKQHPLSMGVINAQPPYATLCAVSGKKLDYGLLPKTVFELGVLPLVPYAEPGSRELEEKVFAACVGYNGLLLENRGLLVWGFNPLEALTRLELAEQQAFLTWHLGFSGDYALTEDQAAPILKRRELWEIHTGGVPRVRSREKPK
jgi:L-fuculose-phosphate aldolase